MSAPEPYEPGRGVAYTIHRNGATLAGTGTIVGRHPNADGWRYVIRSAVDPKRALFASHEEVTPFDEEPEDFTGESLPDTTSQALARAGLDPRVFDLERARAEVQAELGAFDPDFATILARTLAQMQAHADLVKAIAHAAHFLNLATLLPDVHGAFVHLCEVDPTAARP